MIFQYDNLECVYEIQVGFASVSDYITYTWVKDDEVALNEEVIQVTGCTDELGIDLDTLSGEKVSEKKSPIKCVCFFVGIC